MIDHQRRDLLLSALIVPLAAGLPIARAATDMPMPPHEIPGMDADMAKVPWVRNEEIAMLVYPGMTVMDLIGPHSMFGAMMGAKIHIVSKTLDPVTSDAGLTLIPTATFDTCPKELTVLFAPGGTDGTLAAARDPQTLAFLADRGARASYITSVCSGSLILGAAGLLKGYRATSHWSCRDALAGFGAIPVDARVVHDRNRITGAGVTAGLDFGLEMVAMLRDRTYAECTQLMGEYDPHPPFNAGSMRTAPANVKKAMIELVADFSRKAQALATASSV